MGGFYAMPPSRRGYDMREVVSSLQKAIRASDTDAALYWAFELDKSGYSAWCWKRLLVICSEDIGPAAPGLAGDVRALYTTFLELRKRKGDEVPGERGDETQLLIAHAVIAMCQAPKSRVTDWALWYHNSDHVERREVPDVAHDKHTAKGKKMGRGEEHFVHEASKLTQPTETLEALEERYFDKAVAKIERRLAAANPWGEPRKSTKDEGTLPAVRRLPGA